jgi:SWI/SNF-related matrix-associated actin-dependent regulator of chromatin subfamily A3
MSKATVIDLTADEDEVEEEEEEEEELLLYTSRVLIKGLQHYRGVAHPGEYVNLVRELNNHYDRNAIRVLNLDQMQVGHIQKEVAAVLAPLMDDRRGLATIEATIPRPSGTWTQDLDLEIYTTAADRAAVNEILLRRREHAFRLVPGPGAPPTPVAAAAAYAAVPAAAQIVSKKNMSAKPKSQHAVEQLMDQLQAKQWPEFSLATLGAASALILSNLYPHQLQGLSFLVHRETDEGLPPFWTEINERGSRVFFNSITSSSRAQRPAPVRGGVLADDMGLGKSIQMLSLIVARPPPGVVYTVGAHRAATEQAQQMCDDQGWEGWSAADLQKACKEHKINGAGSKAELVDKLRLFASAGPAAANVNKTTLIVCPLSVMQGWADQIDAHIAPHSLRYYLYSGAGRVADEAFLRSFDIVLVSYSTLAAELANGPPVAAGNKRGRDAGGVLGMEFHRIILDEAHSIRNRQTKIFQACLALKGKYRWALSGTPIQNKSEDAYPLFAFLKAEPCSAWDVFNRAVARPIKEGDVDGITRLRAFFSGVTLRRNKDVIRQLLPPKVITLHTLRMTDKQREAYTLIFSSAQAAVRAAMEAEGDQGNIFSSILECIMRLRQACDDVSIVPPERLQRAAQLLARIERGEVAAAAAAAAAGGVKKKLTVEDARLLFAALQGALAEEDASCCICFEELSEEKTRLLRACRHSLCDTCAEAMLQKPPCACPLCRAPFGRNDVMESASIREAAGPAEEGDDEGANGDDLKPAAGAAAGAAAEAAEVSPKVTALLEAIAAMREEAGGEQLKAVVFSQFVSYLDVIQQQLRVAGVSFSRLDGSMTQKRRSAQLAKWRIANTDGGPTVLIVSTRAGGQGLNLTEGSRVFLLDPLWSAAAEEQAMDRVHRLGQRKRVVVTRYVMENSIEEKILKLQQNKAALNKGALTKLTPAELAAARRAEIKSLFEL